tara:strand:+ start:16000 stop:18681 length:2682 start_codon:yes stop_codon:yes gene_type:complete
MFITTEEVRFDESNGYKYYTVSLSEASAGTVTVDYIVRSVIATEGADFSQSRGTLTFAPSETAKTLAVYSRQDAFDEFDESFELLMFNPTGGGEFENGQTSLSTFGWILDEDGAANDLALSVSDPVITEGHNGKRIATFTISLSEAPASALTVDWSTRDGSAKAGEDYVADNGSVAFYPGQTTATVEIEVNGDRDVEASEKFSLLVSPPGSVHSGEWGAAGTATILDDDADDITISLETDYFIEDNGYQYIVATLSKASAGTVTVDYRLKHDSTAENYDFSSASGTLTFAAGDTRAQLAVYIRSDTLDEVDENFLVELANPTGGASLAGGEPILHESFWIYDDDGAANDRAMTVSDPMIVEGDDGRKTALFEVQLSRPASEDLELAYRTVDGTAEAGEDYVETTGTLVFEKGQGFAAVEVPIIGDGARERSETFTLAFDTPDGVYSGGYGAAGKATILDDDPGVTISIADQTFTESNGYATFTVTLSEPATGQVSVGYRTIDQTATSTAGDFSAITNGLLTFAAGQTSKTISIYIRSDTLDEGDEAFEMELFEPTGGAHLTGGGSSLRATGWILDDDGSADDRAMFVSETYADEGHPGSAGEAVFNVKLSRALDQARTLTWSTAEQTAKAGGDFVDDSGDLRFRAGQTEATVRVATRPDHVREEAETFRLNIDYENAPIHNNNGYSAVATILDDDRPDNRAGVHDGTSGRDNINGRGGDDEIRGFGSADKLKGAGGKDAIRGGDGSDKIKGGGGGDKLWGDGDDDVISGGGGNDNVWGGSGDDKVSGDAGNDKLYGGAQNDIVDGGAGKDKLWGDEGRDLFTFSRRDGKDKVLDWQDGADKIDLSNYAGISRWKDVDLKQKKAGVLVDLDVKGDAILIVKADIDDMNAGDFIL